MSKVVIGIQARLTSTRFPRKVFAEIAPGVTVLDSCIQGCLESELPVILLIPDTPENDELAEYDNGDIHFLGVFRGPEDDVLKRYVLMAESEGLEPDDYIVRITSDCPFTDGEMIANMVDSARRLRLQYLSNVFPRTFPKGLDIEAIGVGTLLSRNMQIAPINVDDTHHDTAMIKRIREHVTLDIVPIMQRDNYYNDGTKYPTDPDIRWTVDTPEDLEVCKAEWQRRDRQRKRFDKGANGETVINVAFEGTCLAEIESIDGESPNEYFEHFVQEGLERQRIDVNPDQVNRTPRETKA